MKLNLKNTAVTLFHYCTLKVFLLLQKGAYDWDSCVQIIKS